MVFSYILKSILMLQLEYIFYIISLTFMKEPPETSNLVGTTTHNIQSELLVFTEKDALVVQNK